MAVCFFICVLASYGEMNALALALIVIWIRNMIQQQEATSTPLLRILQDDRKFVFFRSCYA